MTGAACAPYLIPYGAVTDRWVARCDACGWMEEHGTKRAAQRAVDDHRERDGP